MLNILSCIDDDHKDIPLIQGEDYTVSYINNKKVGTGIAKISFIGNYKGAKGMSKKFRINQAALRAEDTNLVVRDFTYNPKKKKASSYFAKNGSTMFVTLNGVLLRANEYTAKFYQGNTELNKNSELVFEGDKAIIKVVIAPNPKNQNYVVDPSSTISTEYRVNKKADLIDVSSAKVKLVRKDDPSKAATISYTGQPITFDGEHINNQEACIKVEIKNGINTITLIENGVVGTPQVSDYFSIRYINNSSIGTARIILTPLSNSNYSGSAIGSFAIKKLPISQKIVHWIRG